MFFVTGPTWDIFQHDIHGGRFSHSDRAVEGQSLASRQKTDDESMRELPRLTWADCLAIPVHFRRCLESTWEVPMGTANNNNTILLLTCIMGKGK